MKNQRLKKYSLGQKLITLHHNMVVSPTGPSAVIWQPGEEYFVQGIVRHRGYTEYLVTQSFDKHWESIADYLMPKNFRSKH